jgi:NADH-quinone oxidoreductase subunit J
MFEWIATLLFYGFAIMTVLSALMVITLRNPVHSVFFLILAFFNAAGLFVLLGAEYIAMTLVIVYVGAVAVLFLFVVMMLDVNFAELRQGFLKYLPMGAGVAGILFFELCVVFFLALSAPETLAPVRDAIPDASYINNTQSIGRLMYTSYIYLFQIAGLILLVAMIGAIVLTLRHRPGVRRQRISRQVNRTREESIAIVHVRPGEGIGA